MQLGICLGSVISSSSHRVTASSSLPCSCLRQVWVDLLPAATQRFRHSHLLQCGQQIVNMMVTNNSPPSPSLLVYACKNAAESVQYSPWFVKPASIFLQIRRSVRGRDDGNSFVTLVKCRKGLLWVTSNFVSALPLSEQPHACMPTRAALSCMPWDMRMAALSLQDFAASRRVSEYKSTCDVVPTSPSS